MSEPTTDAPLVVDLLKACYWFEGALRHNQAAAGLPTVTRAQAFLLALVSTGEHRATRIARALGISRQATSRMLGELISQGVLKSVPDPSDARAQLVVFSEEHTPIKNASGQILLQLEGVLEKKFGESNIDIVRHVLKADWGPYPLVSDLSR